MDQPDLFPAVYSRQCPIEGEGLGSMEDLMRNVASKTFFKLVGIAVEDKKEWIETGLSIQRLQFAEHPRSVSARRGEITVREN